MSIFLILAAILLVGMWIGYTLREKRTMEHQQLVEAALVAIDKVFSDMSVEPEEVRDSLREILDEIEIKIEALED